MDEALVAAVRQRAAGQCEYCQLSDRVHPGPFEIEHVISTQHGGATLLSNLAYSCLHCNRHKGPNLAGLARIRNTSKLIPLFHPRRHKWSRHFRWSGPLLIGQTPIGRVTIYVLAMNAPLRVALREELIAEGLFPSKTG
ncbi:MAG: HNH endonuclease signature motif containing protein [Planctomycetota bacterium]